MSDDWQKQPEYKSDVQQVDKTVDTQVKPITAAQDMLANMPFFGGFRINLVGSTNFEDHRLNDMIDLVEHANPEHLELTSKALFDAGKDIRKAATELEQHLKVDWEGQGADSFHGWTQQLLQYTHHLAGYADQAGTHLSVAATGLASARISMPPRDTRPAAEQKKPTELPKAKQVDDNPDYVAAVKVEKNRQEAINQMNRLASYYKVAATDLGKQKEPEPLKPITDVGVPEPKGDGYDKYRRYDPVSPSSPRTALSADVPTGHHTTVVPNSADATGHVAPHQEPRNPVTSHGHDVGTEINTVGTLPPTPAPHATPTPTLPTTGGGSGHTPPLPPGPVTPPIGPTVGRSTGYGPATRLPLSPQGRTGPSGTSSGRLPQGAGRVPQEPEAQTGRANASGRVPQGPMGQAARAAGRATPTGQPGMRGATQAERSPLGRGVTGGTPRPVNTPTGRTGATGPGSPARNGVVGGKPVTGRPSGAGPGSRMPRGTVVGAEEPVPPTSVKGSAGRRGVVGSPAAKAEPGNAQEVLRSAANPEGVIGAPRTAASPLEGSAGHGGDSGLGRGVVGDRRGPEGGSGRVGESTEKEHRRRAQKQRRDASQKSD
ncbi:hypothetical protein AQJ66_35295 [Streptomyces bungoensis]|uniref:Uncharacterized protein n=1 Tax=Streptomyces bungoensis TaxID=285568 RepID=A0A101SLN0_9ACTN|nr:hypothetical protein [Streptomyces bungoensis]KUN76013.1 hypothetical protein AQJ66_35295 [Streptomyces bungoensis]